MRMSIIAIAVVSLFFSVARTTAQTPSGIVASVAVTNPTGGTSTLHAVQLRNVSPSSSVRIVLFDPGGTQTVLDAATDSSGSADVALSPPAGGWQLGVYRVVARVAGNRSVSAIFSAGDGGEHLMVSPELPSPTSAIEVIGLGLPVNSRITIALTLAGGLGVRTVSAATDAYGTLDTFIWPHEIGFDFLSAGRYELALSDSNLTTAFYIREHPSTSFIDAPATVVANQTSSVRLSAYQPNRYLWVQIATVAGATAGQFLLGPTDASGTVSASVRFPDLAPGTYEIGTPYDWGETTFSVPEPSPTATATPTLTATTTPPPTVSPRPTVKPTARASCSLRKGHKKKRCK